MNKHILFFLAAFAVGSLIALVARAAWFKPYVDHSAHTTTSDYAPMVTNPAAPVADDAANAETKAAPAPTPAVDPHAHHDGATNQTTVNTKCTICGMDVDPAIEPYNYNGKLIGFGCRLCPPKFAADPERYAPAALENKVVGN